VEFVVDKTPFVWCQGLVEAIRSLSTGIVSSLMGFSLLLFQARFDAFAAGPKSWACHAHGFLSAKPISQGIYQEHEAKHVKGLRPLFVATLFCG
jgi:hypothetical protein